MIDPGTATLASTVLGGIFGGIGADKQNFANHQMMLEQQRFQQHNADTAYQRAMADMRAAGLNPMLAYQQGGAGTPPGGVAHMENTMEALSTGAKDLAMNMAELKNIQAQTEKIEQDKKTSQAQERLTKKEEQQVDLGNQVTSSQMGAIKAEAEARQGTAKVNAWSDTAGNILGNITNAINLKRLFMGDSLKEKKNTQEHDVTEHYNAKGEHTGTTHRRRSTK